MGVLGVPNLNRILAAEEYPLIANLIRKSPRNQSGRLTRLRLVGRITRFFFARTFVTYGYEHRYSRLKSLILSLKLIGCGKLHGRVVS
jgi:hypothetical protein